MTPTASLTVVEPGLFSTIQDRGRPDWTRFGVPPGGACDQWSLAAANLLAGNDAGAAAIEMTVVGSTFRVDAAATIALAGADLGGIVRETGVRLEPWRTNALAAGSTIAFPGVAPAATAPEPAATPASTGCRAYLAISGGFDVPRVLGSAATLVSAGFGGLDGRPLREGDLLRGRSVSGAAAPGRTWPVVDGDPFAEPEAEGPLRVVRGPSPAGLAELISTDWRVASGSDRVGLRLEGGRLDVDERGELLSHGVVFGAVQLPPGGSPIVLLADHQTTGGYPIVAVVISADHPRLGQIRPGASVGFIEVSLDEARRALITQRVALKRAGAILRDDAGWDALWRSAGG